MPEITHLAVNSLPYNNQLIEEPITEDPDIEKSDDPTSILPDDILRKIFQECTKECTDLNFLFVCRRWYYLDLGSRNQRLFLMRNLFISRLTPIVQNIRLVKVFPYSEVPLPEKTTISEVKEEKGKEAEKAPKEEKKQTPAAIFNPDGDFRSLYHLLWQATNVAKIDFSIEKVRMNEGEGKKASAKEEICLSLMLEAANHMTKYKADFPHLDLICDLTCL